MECVNPRNIVEIALAVALGVALLIALAGFARAAWESFK